MTRHERLGRHGHGAGLLLSLLALTSVSPRGVAGATGDPAVGSWATYQWTSTLTQEVPVLVKEQGPGGQATWSLARESAPPPPIFVTYSIVRGDAKTYVLQIVTHMRVDGPPLSVTQVTVDRASGKALRSVIKRPKGLIATPESGLRPFPPPAAKGTEEAVVVPAGRFAAVRAPHRDGPVWVSDQVPAMRLVKAAFKTGQLELVRSGASGAKDLLRS